MSISMRGVGRTMRQVDREVRREERRGNRTADELVGIQDDILRLFEGAVDLMSRFYGRDLRKDPSMRPKYENFVEHVVPAIFGSRGLLGYLPESVIKRYRERIED